MELLSVLFMSGVSSLVFYGVIIGVVIFLVKSSNKKHPQAKIESIEVESTQDAPANSSQNETTMIASTSEEKPAPRDPYGLLNILLYFGSFLIVCAMYLFAMNTNESYVAPITIILTLILYFGGLCLYKLVDYLKNVGKAFCLTSLAILPFWVISLGDFSIKVEAAWAITALIGMILYSGASILMKSRVIPFFAYIWLLIFTLAINPFASADKGYVYWLTIAPMIVSLIPMVLWLTKPSWLPTSFRSATMAYGKSLLPVIYLFTLILFLVPNAGLSYPFLRTILATLLTAFTLAHFAKNHSHTAFILSRFAVQSMLFSAVSDATNFSFFAGLFGNSKASEQSLIIVALVWLFCFLAQAIISIFIPKKSETSVKSERVVEVVSLIGIFLTLSILPDLSEAGALTIKVSIYSVIPILGVVYSIYHKNCCWGIATIVGLSLVPVALGNSGRVVNWDSWFNMLYFMVFGIFALLAYYFSDRAALMYSRQVSSAGLCVASLFLLASTADLDYIEIGWLLVAAYTAALGYMSKTKWLYEVSVYSGALCLFSLVGTIGDSLERSAGGSNVSCSGSYYTDYVECIKQDDSPITMTASLIRAYIIPAALFATSFIKEGEKVLTRRVRFILGYCLLTLLLLYVGTEGGQSWMLASLFTQILFLIYSVLKDESWLIWTSIVVLIITMTFLTNGINFIWFGVVGLILILIVVWRLTKMHKADTAVKMLDNNSNDNNSNNSGATETKQ